MDGDIVEELHNCAREGLYVQVYDLLNQGIDPDVRSNSLTPLMVAAQYSRREVFEQLINFDANINCYDNIQRTVLHHAAYGGSIEIIRYLVVNRGVAPDVKDSSGLTPLMIAALGSNIHVIDFLVNSGADLNCRDANGETALHLAVFIHATEVVEYLVNSRVDIDAANSVGKTPLMMVVCDDSPDSDREIVDLLIKAGANIHFRDWRGWTLLHYSVHLGWFDILQLLLQRGFDINARTSNGDTPFHLALLVVDIEIVSYLIQEGADWMLENNHGETPFSILIEDKCVELIKMCIQKGGYVQSAYCIKLIEDPLLKEVILQDVKLCSQALMNEFNNKDLPLLYREFPHAQALPPIHHLQIKNESGMALEIEKGVINEILNKGYCNLCQFVPLILSISCVRTIIERMRVDFSRQNYS